MKTLNTKSLFSSYCEFPIFNRLLFPFDSVPFAVEEKSGTISVVDEINKFERTLYNFEAIAKTNDKSLSLSTNVTIHVAESETNAIRFVLLMRIPH